MRAISKLENVKVQVKVSNVPMPEGEIFQAEGVAEILDKERVLGNGAPLVTKAFSVNVRGETFDDAREKALDVLEDLLGIKGE